LKRSTLKNRFKGDRWIFEAGDA